MKTLLLTCLLPAATCAYAALSTPSASQLTDYQTWFSEFNVASDKTMYGEPSPVNSLPAAFADSNRSWSGWTPNMGPSSPLTNGAPQTLYVEVVFLGETAGWWNDLGVRITSGGGTTEYLLADGIQAAGAGANTTFGDFTTIALAPGESLDFYYNGTRSYAAGDGDNPNMGPGGRYYAFDTTLNSPATVAPSSYMGTLAPLTSVRGDAGDPFTVIGFEDINDGAGWNDRDFNDLIFGFRAAFAEPQGPVPEPSTYGLIGAGALLALVGYRRYRRKA